MFKSGGVPIGEAFTEDPTDFAAKKSPGKGEAKDTYCGPCYGTWIQTNHSLVYS
jgi:hypothetical protein